MTDFLYRCEGIPAMQNRLYPSHEEALSAATGEVELTQDSSGLTFNHHFRPDLVTYDENYQNDQGYSIQFQRHLESVYDLCSVHIRNKSDLVVDIGCGKGGFVELLRSKGHEAVGYDNAYQGTNPHIRKCFFGPSVHEKGELLILRHVLEHIPSPWKFIEAISNANNNRGHLYIEVPDLDWILQNHAHFDIFHEHVNYFRIDDFIHRFGASLIHHTTTFGGQYLSLVLDLESARKADAELSNMNKHRKDLRQGFAKLNQHEHSQYASLGEYAKIAIWGAAAKGVMFACKAPSTIRKNIAYAIDINPRKQGYFMPITGIKVIDPSSGINRLDPSTLVVIMNPNYEMEIRESLPKNQPYTVLK